MNWLWGGMLIIALIVGLLTGTGDVVLEAMMQGAQEAVNLCISLAGSFMLWMGLMNVAKAAGLMESLSRLAAPLFKKLFPNSPKAVAPITLNLAANFFGLGSAATPFGLEAMEELQKTNPKPDTATDDMCMFIALNASAVELIPTGVLAMRTAAGSQDPYAIVIPTFVVSLLSAITAVAWCLRAQKRGKK